MLPCADCEHEIRPVTAGHRLCLTYNLVFTGAGPPPPAIEGGVSGGLGMGIGKAATSATPRACCCSLGLPTCCSLGLPTCCCSLGLPTCPHFSITLQVFVLLHKRADSCVLLFPDCTAYTARMVGLVEEWSADDEAPMKMLYVLSHQ